MNGGMMQRRWLRALAIAKILFAQEGYHTRYLEEIEEVIRRHGGEGYPGKRTPGGVGVKVTVIRVGKRLLPHMPFHSPTGFAWGYGRAGPAPWPAESPHGNGSDG
jgi:hypothetical protein